ncbi:hypothetical protein COB21_03805 [Candidatus Aerophobetes bacterium]|uniref:Uncharacterized protein n=1 Tax=Aerophobetes bacterium TaxID=2030807 RepID=A0A2A4X4A4_UNCAE|nr:MAG: hypothetical protein COB21_03805 [Candidatus Aerophobetes bacterium]
MKNKRIKKSTLFIALLAMGGLVLGNVFADNAKKVKTEEVVVAVEQEELVDYKKKWKKLQEENSNFTIYFPGKAVKSEIEMPIPGENKSLSITKHSFEKEGITYSISQATLPQEWLKYGPKLVLKGALKLIAKHSGDADIAGKTDNNFKNFNSLDYKHVSGDKQAVGTLILCGSEVYTVEVETAHHMDESEYSAQLKSFLDSFHPEVIVAKTEATG